MLHDKRRIQIERTKCLFSKSFQGVGVQDKGGVSLPESKQLPTPFQDSSVCHGFTPT